jgi:hypothetical protein
MRSKGRPVIWHCSLSPPAPELSAPLELLHGSTKAELSRMLSNNCCCRCMRESAAAHCCATSQAVR